MENRVITVKGTGKVSAAPDLLILEMNLETVKAEYEITMRSAAETLDALRAAIESAGHDGKMLKTSSFNINTKYERYRDKNNNYQSKFIGYCCTHELRLEFDLDMEKLSATLGAIAACKANPKLTIRFSVKDTSAVSSELLESVIHDAKWKAEVLANSAGVKLGVIQRIDYNWSELQVYSNTDLRVADNIMLCAEPMSIDIEPEDINVSDMATVVWAIE